MSDAGITKEMRSPASGSEPDWSRFDAMTEEERHQAALSDPDAQPLSEADFKRMKRTPQTKIIRRALSLSQEQFSAKYQIPLLTLQDWENGKSEPDQPARAYLRVIACDPEGVSLALQRAPRR